MNGFEAPIDDSPYSAISGMDRLRSEPDKIIKWREEQEKMITQKGKRFTEFSLSQ